MARTPQFAGKKWRRNLRFLLAAVFVAASGQDARAQFTQPVLGFTRSRSGQFLVHDAAGSAVAPRNIATNSAFIRLEPTLLAVSAERLKTDLYRELGIARTGSAKIHLYLFRAQTGFEPVMITSEHFKDGWQYRVDLAGWIPRERFARAMVQVLLTEFANRNAGERSAEIPAWLLEGLTRQILIASGSEILIPPPGPSAAGIPLGATNFNLLRENPLQHAHDLLEQSPPLTFEQLSWPGPHQFDGPGAERYISSAQLFVQRLLHLGDGRECLRAMLADLPLRLNWQFAFLKSFHRYFQRPLDAEKWWALQTLNFAGRALAQTWSEEESWQRLDSAVHSFVQVRTGTNDLPLHTSVTLQRLVRESDPQRQSQLLKEKVRELDLLRIRLAPRFVPVLDDYRRTLENYVQVEEKVDLALFQRKSAHKRAADQLLNELDALDYRRLSMQPIAARIAVTRE